MVQNFASKFLNILLATALIILIIKFDFASNPDAVDNTDPEVNETLKIIHQRKSVRAFTDKSISKRQLEEIVKAGMAAPTAINRQPWVFIAIDDRETLDKLGGNLPYSKMLKTATGAIVVCGDMNKALTGSEQEFWIQDCSAASENILLATESMDLGAVWTALYPARGKMETVTEILKLPDNLIPLNVIPIGYPDGEFKPKDKWKPENLRWNKWGE